MQSSARTRSERSHDLLRRWRAGIFTLVPETPARRRATDVGRLVIAVASLTLIVVAVRNGTPFEARATQLLDDVPNGLRWLVTTLCWIGSIGVVVVVVGLAIVTKHVRLARDAALAAALAWGVGLLTRAAVAADHAGSTNAIEGISREFPVIELAAAVAVVATIAPDLARPARRALNALVILAVVAAVPAGIGLPLDITAAVVVGWAVAAIVHLAFGTPEGIASTRQVIEASDDLGITLVEVEPRADQDWGVARYVARDDHGTPLEVSVYGRDASDAQFLAKVWRFAFYRDAGQSLALTRALQVEHEAFLLLLAARHDVPAPSLLASGTGGDSGDALVITRGTDGRSLSDLDSTDVSDQSLASIWDAVSRLREARIAHGAIDGTTIVLESDARVTLRDFRQATANATDERLDRDVAATLIATALAVGAERSVKTAVDRLGTEAVRTALPQVQPAAATRHSRHALHGEQKHLDDEVRAQGALATDTDAPELAKLRRITPVDAAIVVGTFVGVWALIGELSSFDDIWATIQTANWWWVAAAFVLSQVTNVAQAVAITGTVSTPLALGPVIALQFANAFTGLAGGTVATTATTIRFFQRRGLGPSVAISSGVLVSIASFCVQFALFLIAFPFAAGSFTLGQTGGSASGLAKIVVLVLILAAVGAGVAVILPRFRRQIIAKLKPQVDEARENLRALAGQPRNLIRLFGGNAAAQLLFALTLGASLHAYGASTSLATLLVVNTLASILGGMAPVPGGMGVMEAGLIAGLTAAGIPDNQAVAATLTHRMFTAYLPPIWGWFTLVWLRRHEYL